MEKDTEEADGEKRSTGFRRRRQRELPWGKPKAKRPRSDRDGIPI